MSEHDQAVKDQLDWIAEAERRVEQRQVYVDTLKRLGDAVLACEDVPELRLSGDYLRGLWERDQAEREAGDLLAGTGTALYLRGLIRRAARQAAGLPEQTDWERYLDRLYPKARRTAGGRKAR